MRRLAKAVSRTPSISKKSKPRLVISAEQMKMSRSKKLKLREVQNILEVSGCLKSDDSSKHRFETNELKPVSQKTLRPATFSLLQPSQISHDSSVSALQKPHTDTPPTHSSSLRQLFEDSALRRKRRRAELLASIGPTIDHSHDSHSALAHTMHSDLYNTTTTIPGASHMHPKSESPSVVGRIEMAYDSLSNDQSIAVTLEWFEVYDLSLKHQSRWSLPPLMHTTTAELNSSSSSNPLVTGCVASDEQLRASLSRYLELKQRIDEFPVELRAKVLDYGRDCCHEPGMTADNVLRQLDYEIKNIEESRKSVEETMAQMRKLEERQEKSSAKTVPTKTEMAKSKKGKMDVNDIMDCFTVETTARLSAANERTQRRPLRKLTLAHKILATLEPQRVAHIAVRTVTDMFNTSSVRSAQSESDNGSADALYSVLSATDRIEREHRSDENNVAANGMIDSMNSAMTYTTLLSALGRTLEEDAFLTQRVLAQTGTHSYWLRRELSGYHTGRKFVAAEKTEDSTLDENYGFEGGLDFANGDNADYGADADQSEESEGKSEGGSLEVDSAKSSKGVGKSYLSPTTRMKLCRVLGLKLGDKWDEKTRVQLASIVFKCMVDACRFGDGSEQTAVGGAPIFSLQSVVSSTTRTVSVVRIKNEAFLALIRSQPRYRPPRELKPVSRPMVCVPRPWRNVTEGPFFYYNEQVMRAEDSKYQMRPLKDTCDKLSAAGVSQMSCLQPMADAKSDLGTFMECLNAIQSVPWVLNEPIIAMIRWLYEERGGGVAKIPPKADAQIPSERLSVLNKETMQSEPESDGDFKYRLQTAHKENRERHSLRCDLELRLKLASELAAERQIYFPVNVDFRGRVYPIPPHINLIGSDLVRSMCTLAEKKPLGERGWFWLKVNLANKFGYDKVSNEMRVQWTEERMAQVLDCAKNPKENDWWLTAADPFQALSTMIELSNALDSGSPQTFESGLPVGMDGSCNGLQHYAAMLKDSRMAEYVNVAARDVCGDVYSAVKDRVVAMVAEDACDERSGHHAVAKLLTGDKITRKVLKQTVMTSVYGVTEYGAKAQIRKWLKDANIELPTPVEEFELKCAMYLAKYTMHAIGQTNTPAWLSMLWLKCCAQKIAAKGHRVTWQTPLALPCTQHYADGGDNVATALGASVLLTNNDGAVKIGKQVSAFPPNFVHSLDSTHCLMTARRCAQLGLRFASIHDSFWTHACDVDTMNAVLREEFVKLHSESLLSKLYHHFCKQYPEIDFEPPPEPSDFDLEEVKQSQFFFS